MTTILDLVNPSRKAHWAMLYCLGQAAADHDPDPCTIQQLGNRLTILSLDTSHGPTGHGIALLLANDVEPGVRLITSITKIEFVCDLQDWTGRGTTAKSPA